MEKQRPPVTITEQDFLSGKYNFVEPRALSFRAPEYYRGVSSHFTMFDVKALCNILMHSPEEIYTPDNSLKLASGNCELSFGENEHVSYSGRVEDILASISEEKNEQRMQLKMNNILHDAAQLLTKHDPEQLKLKVAVYNNLLNKGFINIR